MDESKVKVKSLFKALKLLDHFSEQATSLKISDVAEQENLPKSTVHNIFSTFAAYGMLTQDSYTGRYSLGPQIAKLSNIYFSTNPALNMLRSEMERVSAIANETVYFGTFFENQVLYLEAVYPSSMNRTSSVIGVTAPLYCTGIGKSILAWSEPSVVDAVFSEPVTKFTENTIVDKATLVRELEDSRNVGFTIDNMEHEYGVKCVAVPIFRLDNSLAGAMSITCPSLRMEGKYELFSNLLKDAQRSLRSYL